MRPGNEFLYSSWDDTTHAVREIDQHLNELQSGHVPTQAMWVVFAPTGKLQEVSLSSGWSEEYMELASRFDDALGS